MRRAGGVSPLILHAVTDSMKNQGAYAPARHSRASGRRIFHAQGHGPEHVRHAFAENAFAATLFEMQDMPTVVDGRHRQGR